MTMCNCECHTGKAHPSSRFHCLNDCCDQPNVRFYEASEYSIVLYRQTKEELVEVLDGLKAKFITATFFLQELTGEDLIPPYKAGGWAVIIPSESTTHITLVIFHTWADGFQTRAEK